MTCVFFSKEKLQDGLGRNDTQVQWQRFCAIMTRFPPTREKIRVCDSLKREPPSLLDLSKYSRANRRISLIRDYSE